MCTSTLVLAPLRLLWKRRRGSTGRSRRCHPLRSSAAARSALNIGFTTFVSGVLPTTRPANSACATLHRSQRALEQRARPQEQVPGGKLRVLVRHNHTTRAGVAQVGAGAGATEAAGRTCSTITLGASTTGVAHAEEELIRQRGVV